LWSLLIFAAADLSHAEPLGAELLATSVVATKDASISPVDEIVVVGVRGEDGTIRPARLLDDEQLQRIMRDLEKKTALERESAWRLRADAINDVPPALRVGYDLRDQDREPARNPSLELPMELVQPAVFISADFD
jgi:hypothetical protein